MAFPRLPKMYLADGGWAYIKAFRQAHAAYSTPQIPDFRNVLFGKCSHSMVFSAGVSQSCFDGVMRVLARRNYLKVLYAVIFLLTVFMVYLKSLWDRPDECRHNKSVNKALPFIAILRKCGPVIPAPNNLRDQHPRFTTAEPRKPSHTTKIGYLVDTFVVFYWEPVFHTSHYNQGVGSWQ
jgi:hypothetical protein